MAAALVIGARPLPLVANVCHQTRTGAFLCRMGSRDDVIRDLRGRLDAEAEERRKLTLLLTEVRNTPTPEVEKPKGLWQRLFSTL